MTKKNKIEKLETWDLDRSQVRFDSFPDDTDFEIKLTPNNLKKFMDKINEIIDYLNAKKH